MNIRILGILVVAASFVGCSKPVPDREQLSGKWDYVSIIDNGMEKKRDGYAMEFVGDQVNLYKGKPEPRSAQLKLDETKNPKWLDLLVTQRNIAVLGIYELKGDDLKICFAEGPQDEVQRPTAFTSEKGTRHSLIVLRRQKK